jgi:hypothetical protein
MIVLALANASQAPAGEPAKDLQVASIGADHPQTSSRGARPTQSREAEVAQLLAQIETQPARRDGVVALNVLLVELAPDLPPGSAESLGKDHGLEIVDILDFPSLTLRLIRYRIRDGSVLADVLPRLRQDARVRSAQTNVVYRAPEPQQPQAPAASPTTTARAPQEAKVLAQPSQRAKGKLTSAKASARKDVGIATPSPAWEQPERSPASVTQTALRFPTADEPFVNRGGR